MLVNIDYITKRNFLEPYKYLKQCITTYKTLEYTNQGIIKNHTMFNGFPYWIPFYYFLHCETMDKKLKPLEDILEDIWVNHSEIISDDFLVFPKLPEEIVANTDVYIYVDKDNNLIKVEIGGIIYEKMPVVQPGV